MKNYIHINNSNIELANEQVKKFNKVLILKLIYIELQSQRL